MQMQELQEELNNVSRDKQKVAVKKVVAGMMVGKDVSSLFMSMLKCMQTTDLELKKLVYLYLINCKPVPAAARRLPLLLLPLTQPRAAGSQMPRRSPSSRSWP